MTKKDSAPVSTLRKKAEEQLLTEAKNGAHYGETTDPAEIIHELHVHQIELELQNEELIAEEEVSDKLRQQYQALFDGAPVGYVLLKADSTIVRINRQAEAFFSVLSQDVIKKRLAAFLDPDALPVFQTFLADCFHKPGTHSCEIHHLKGTSPVPTPQVLHLTGSIARDYGEQKHCLIAITDISERKAMEEELAENEYRYRELFNNVSEAIYVHEITPEPMRGRLLEVNDVACQRLGYTREELLQLRLGDITATRTRKDDPARVKELQQTGFLTFQDEQVRKDGTVFPVEVRVRTVDIHNQPCRLALVRDLTEEQENARRKALSLKQIEENLTQLAILNDKLRNPLAVIAGTLDEISDEKAEIILQQVQEIDAIVDKLDRGWLESDKIRGYLREHYGIESEGYEDDSKAR